MILPFILKDTDGNEHGASLWRNDADVCELKGDGNCVKNGFYYGTEDSREPKFCARHYFAGTNCESGFYKIVDKNIYEGESGDKLPVICEKCGVRKGDQCQCN